MAFSEQKPGPEIDEEIAGYDRSLKLLQVRYEQYFIGIERREPREDRDNLRKRLMALKMRSVKNTGLKFRIESLWNRFTTYDRMWTRTVKEMEEGTYRRDKFKARLRGYSKQTTSNLLTDKKEETAQSKKRDKEQQKRAADAASKQAGSSLCNDRVDKIYQALVMAKRKCNEDVSKMSREGLARSLKKQLPSLTAKHGGKDVDFKVVIKGGKALLKAVPK